MDLAYKIAKLGRSARNAANIKNRQPLQEMLLSTKALPEYYGEIIKDELNVKKIYFGADFSKYVNFDIKPNLPVIGRKYGKLIPGIKKAIDEKNQMQLAQAINAGESVNIEVQGIKIELNSNNLLVTMHGLEGFAFAGQGEHGIILETIITDELREEGYLREILSKVQNTRKDSDFEVADKITIYVANNIMLEAIIKKFEVSIKKETLAVDVVYDAEREYTQCNINGEDLSLDVEKRI
jgi:isoleucyl-tRNA synthetase